MKIAVIDDERSARNELIYQILHTMPESEISEADSGSSALALMSENDFDILFVDIGLNDMEGTTLAAAARKLLPAAQIVFATAYSQYGVRAFELGVNNYLLKPFDPARVHTVLEKCRRELEGEAAKAADTRQESCSIAPIAHFPSVNFRSRFRPSVVTLNACNKRPSPKVKPSLSEGKNRYPSSI